MKMVDPTLNQTTNESMNHHYINQLIHHNLKISSYLSSGERYELALSACTPGFVAPGVAPAISMDLEFGGG